MKRVTIAFVLLIAALSAALYWRLRAQDLAASGPSRGSGTLEGTRVDVASRLPARIASIPVQEGERVKKGQVVATLECAEPQAALAQAEAAILGARAAVDAAKAEVRLAAQARDTASTQSRAAKAQARAARAQRESIDVRRGVASRTAERLNQMRETGGISEQDLDRAGAEAAALKEQIAAVEAQAAAAEAQATVVTRGESVAAIQKDLAAARLAAAEGQVAAATAARDRAAVAVAECTLYAPMDGVVEDRAFEPGESVMPGSRLLAIVDSSELRATFFLPNAELAAARPGGPVEVVADALPDRRFAGQVRRIGTEAEFTPRNVQTRDDRDRLVYAVEVTVLNADGALRPGMPVEITLAAPAKP